MASTSTWRRALWSAAPPPTPSEMPLPSCGEVRRSGVASVVRQFGKWHSEMSLDGGSRRRTRMKMKMTTATARWQQQSHAQDFCSTASRSWSSASPRLELPDGLQTSQLSTFGTSRLRRCGEAVGTRCFCRLRWIPSPMCHESNSDFSSSEAVQNVDNFDLISWKTPTLSALLGLSAVLCYSEAAHASGNAISNPAYGDVGVVLEAGVQLLYLGALLILLGVGSFLVVRQVLIKRELETAAKELQDRVRKGDASSLDYFELGAVMLRKKFNQLARKYLNEAINKWDGSQQDLAQVYNALGYSYFSDDKIDLAVGLYEKAVKLQPMYVTAWNNLADAYEKQSKFVAALKAYEEALQFDPSNKIASAKRAQMKQRVEKFQGIQ